MCGWQDNQTCIFCQHSVLQQYMEEQPVVQNLVYPLEEEMAQWGIRCNVLYWPRQSLFWIRKKSVSLMSEKHKILGLLGCNNFRNLSSVVILENICCTFTTFECPRTQKILQHWAIKVHHTICCFYDFLEFFFCNSFIFYFLSGYHLIISTLFSSKHISASVLPKIYTALLTLPSLLSLLS